jgi:peptidoglycan lytic transglycosylase
VRRAKTALTTLFAACLAGIYLLAAVRLDQAPALAGGIQEAPRTAPGIAAAASGSLDPPLDAALDPPMIGQAVYYGAELAGQPTASGEIFDPGLLTAAHRTLPLGSEVQVTNLGNGLSTVVRVNDRGPYSDALIDLSTAAAREIGLLPKGSGQVQLLRLR